MNRKSIHLLLLIALVALTRIPFIFDGYGTEEDSWGLVVNAHEMKESGHYVASRFPGHPVQEYAYRMICDQPAWVYNFLSVIVSCIAVAFFFLALGKMQLSGKIKTTLLLCFTPAFFIAGTYTIDFNWALAFVLASFYFLLGRKFIIAGIMIGLATGCRITSGIFLLPWAMLLFNRLDLRAWLKELLLVSIPAVIIGMLLYVPAYLNYGTAFFDYSDQFPYPPVAKVLYKMSIGVWGIPGLTAIALSVFAAVKTIREKNINAPVLFSPQRLAAVCAAIIVLHVVSYLRLPQKSGYMMPAVPFVILLIALFVRGKWLNTVTALFVIAPFLFGMNLTDNLRGSEYSPLAVRFHSSGQEIFFDPLTGPALSERSKRKNKMNYCSEVAASLDTLSSPSCIISGWWYNELVVNYYSQEKNKNATLEFYSTCAHLDSLRKEGVRIYFLPEQDLYNDEMFGQNCTDSIAKPFPVQ